MNFAERLRWVRTKHGLTLEEFGREIGVGRSYLSKLETGQSRTMSELVLSMIGQKFHVRRNWLLHGNGEPFMLHHLNQLAKTGGPIEPFSVMNAESAEKAMIQALKSSGMFFSLNPRINEIGWIVRDLAERLHTGLDAVTVESLRILAHELAAQLDLIADNSALSVGQHFAYPLSELGKKAVGEHNAGKVIEFSKSLSESLTETSEIRKSADMPRTLPEILEQVRNLTKEPGMKAKLSVWLSKQTRRDVPQARVTEWLGKKYEPSGEIALLLMYWVDNPKERK